MKRATVTLPLGINVDLINLSVACTDAQLDAGACPAASRIGSVRADTPLLPTPLSGGAYLMQPKPGQLPGIALDLSLVRLRGSVSFTPQGRLTTQFDGIPDVPLSRLVLQLAGGPKAALRTSQDICSTNPVVDSTFVSQGDVSRSVSSAATVIGCKALKGSVKLKGVKRHRPAVTIDVTSMTPLKELRIGLPRPLKPAAAKQLRKHAKVTGDGRRLKSATVRWRKGRLVIGGLAGARRVHIVLGAGALRQRGTIKPGRTLRFPLTGVDTKGAAKSARLAAKAKR
jgi:hypothetical protein